MVDQYFDELLSFDPMTIAERMAEPGDSEHDTMMLGHHLRIIHNRVKNKELALRMDTYWQMDFDEALSVFREQGFKTVLEETWPSHREGFIERGVVMWSSEGLLLQASSYASYKQDPKTGGFTVPTVQLSGATVYYNWVPNDRNEPRPTESGCYNLFRDGRMLSLRERSAPGDEWVWSGNHDAREGLIHNLSQLRSKGTFLDTWKSDPSVYLSFGMADVATNGNDLRALTQERLRQLPSYVQERVAVSMK